MPDAPGSETNIINCHVHLFTRDHTPSRFPHLVLAWVARIPGIALGLSLLMRVLGQERIAATLSRLHSFGLTGRRKSQEAVFEELRRYYPKETRFVVLPLDLSQSGYGPVRKSIKQQHDELAELSQNRELGEQIIPFANLHPEAPGAFDEFRRAIETYHFRGLKLYPRLGYSPDHPILMEKVYPYCVDHNLPILTHCTRGGIGHRHWSEAKRDHVTDPRRFIKILEQFPTLRVNLAHFGGVQDWKTYLHKGVDPDRNGMDQDDWVSVIREMIRSGKYPTLYTDISYTIFMFEEFAPILKLFLQENAIAQKVLFGSDFYMTRQEALSEKAVSMRLRAELGEDLFRRISHDNPKRWLG